MLRLSHTASYFLKLVAAKLAMANIGMNICGFLLNGFFLHMLLVSFRRQKISAVTRARTECVLSMLTAIKRA